MMRLTLGRPRQPRAVRWVLAITVLIVLVPRAAVAAGSETWPLILVSASGRQHEVEIREVPCEPVAGCTGYIFFGQGLSLRKASVVRPGERVRLVGFGQDKKSNVVVTPITCPSKVTTIVARIAQTNTAGGKGAFIPLSPDGRWTVKLKPGFYALSSSVYHSVQPGSLYLHAGLLGIFVSPSRRHGLAVIPRC